MFATPFPEIRHQYLGMGCHPHAVGTTAALRTPFWRLVWSSQPGTWLTAGEDRIPMSPSWSYLIPPETTCSRHWTAQSDHYYIFFEGDVSLNATQPAIIWIRQGTDLEACRRRLQEEVSSANWDHAELSRLAGFLTAGAICALPREALARPEIDPRIRAAMASLDNITHNTPNNQSLANAAEMNINAFIRLFREVVGEPPQSYAMRQRIAATCRDLALTSRSIEDIAADYDFCNRFHYSHMFKKYRGIGAATFRRHITAQYHHTAAP